MDRSGVERDGIDPHYKQGNVFERDEAYYSQMLSGTRRAPNNLLGSRRQSSMQRSRSRGEQSRISPPPQQGNVQNSYVQQSTYIQQSNVQQSNVQSYGQQGSYGQQSSYGQRSGSGAQRGYMTREEG